MTLAEIAAAVGGTPHGDAEVTAPAAVDSRAVPAGGLFVAVAGEHVDGHDFAAAAVASGAAAVLAARPLDVPCVVVDDVVAALGRLAHEVVARLPQLRVLALTGSQGKTGTKDYLAQVLAAEGATVATEGNLNNEIGVPLTVLRATPETRFLVVEMGARGIGHVAQLCKIVRPQVAAVLNVGTAHLSEFGSREAIATAKGEIVEALAGDGVAVLNADDPLVAAMASRTAGRVVRFGTGAGAEVRFEDVELDELGRPEALFTLGDGPGERTRRRVRLRQVGGHQVANAAAAAAMAIAAGVPPARALEALADAVGLSRWRMEVAERPDGTVVVNDAYNANPASMAAALDALQAIGARAGRRTVAVLGEMRELGDSAPTAHRELGIAATDRGVDVLVTVGEAAALAADAATSVTSWAGTAVSVADRDEALAWLRQHLTAGDVVLVKASRGAALEVLAQALTEPLTEAEESNP